MKTFKYQNLDIKYWVSESPIEYTYKVIEAIKNCDFRKEKWIEHWCIRRLPIAGPHVRLVHELLLKVKT